MAEVSDLLASLGSKASSRALPSLEAGVQEVADALWLATRMTASGNIPAAEPTVSHGGPATKDAAEHGGAASAKPPEKQNESGDDLEPPSVPLWHPTGPPGQLTSAGQAALPLRLPVVRELREPLELQRALRPLKRTVQAGQATVLDEEATVRRSADAHAHTVLPVWTRSAQRWLSLALVIDTSPSMILWDNLRAELHTLLSQLGAFWAIRMWELRYDERSAGIAPLGSAMTSRNPLELVDPTGRQAIFVLTDCVNRAWRPGGVAVEATANWAKTGPLAILQPLTQRMWPRSAAVCEHVRLRAPEPGSSNDRLIVERGRAGEQPPGVPLPILEISPDWFASWAAMVAGNESVDAVVTFSGTPVEHSTAPPSPQDATPRRVVERFMAGASPDALRLAGLLAADDVPLTLPLMRHIQRAMVPDSRPLQLAEVFLGGLLRTVALAEPGRPEMASFAFPTQVRDLLRGTVKRSEASEARRVSERVRAEFSQSRAVSPFGFAALIKAQQGRSVATAGDRQYSGIDPAVVAARGGPYADTVAPGSAGSGELVPYKGEVDLPAAAAVAEATEVVDPRSVTRHIQPSPAAGTWKVGRRFAPDGVYAMTLLGPPESGKTTFLAALQIALARMESGAAGSWDIRGTDAASTLELEKLTRNLSQDRVFPSTSYLGVNRVRFELVGRVPVVQRRRFVGWRRRPDVLRIALDLADVPGELTTPKIHRPGWAEPMNRDELIDTLIRSSAIVFFFDLIGDHERGDFYAHTFAVIAELAQRMVTSDAFRDRYLPHYVSVCISKFDDPKVFRHAQALDLVAYDPSDPYGFPRVDDADAREFLRELTPISRDHTADLAMRTIERFFRPERIRYFVTSAVGFYVDPRTNTFDRSHPENVIRDPERRSAARIRGAVHPINVAEPVLWLTRQLVAATD